MRSTKTFSLSKVLFSAFVLAILFACVDAQTTTYTYTGQLTQSGNPANGSFNMVFTLYSAVSGGAVVGSPINRSVTVTNGTFSVPLDFGAASFPGADRFLEVTVSGVPLTPRTQITSTPYAVRALTVTGPVTGANSVATLAVSNSQPGISNPSPANLPPAALKAEATATNDSTVGVIAITHSPDGSAVVALTTAGGTAVFGLSTDGTGEGVMGEADGANGVGVQGESAAGIAVRAKTDTGQIFVGENETNGDVFSVSALGTLSLSGGISSNSGKFLLNGATGAAQFAGNQFTVDLNGNAVAGGTLSAFLPGGGSSNLCAQPGSPVIRNCSSSLRYKRNIGTFTGGLDIVKKLRPITFQWKENGVSDLGLGAEDVAKVEPLLTTTNDKGDIEGVKYGQVTMVLINAVKQQQEQIERQRAEIGALRALVCRSHRKAAVCKAGK